MASNPSLQGIEAIVSVPPTFCTHPRAGWQGRRNGHDVSPSTAPPRRRSNRPVTADGGLDPSRVPTPMQRPQQQIWMLDWSQESPNQVSTCQGQAQRSTTHRRGTQECTASPQTVQGRTRTNTCTRPSLCGRPAILTAVATLRISPSEIGATSSFEPGWLTTTDHRTGPRTWPSAVADRIDQQHGHGP